MAPDAVCKVKFSMGDAWVAELTYRSAVARLASDLAEQDHTLQPLYEMVKDGERKRRLKLRQHMQVNVFQKHAAMFKRVQQMHTEALESWLTVISDDEAESDDGGKDVEVVESARSADTASSRSGKKTKITAKLEAAKTLMSVNARIQHIANFTGATAVWDEADKPFLDEASDVATENVGNVTPIDFELLTPNGVGGELDYVVSGDLVEDFGGIDVDMYMDFSSDDNDFLPRLADAVRTREKPPVAPSRPAGGRQSSESSKGKKPDRRRRSAPKKLITKAKERGQETTEKFDSVVVLDQSSMKHSFFMDRLLYSGSLLESHYVEFAGLAGLEDDRIRSTSGIATEDDVPKTALVIVTGDQVLHLFEMPRTTMAIAADDASATERSIAPTHGTFVPGCPPSDALRFLLMELEAADLQLKREENAKAPSNQKDSSASPSKLRFMRSKRVAEEIKCFQFNNLVPAMSMHLSECTVRMNNRGGYAVKISVKTQNPRLFSSKLSFGCMADQQAFFEASQCPVSPIA